MGASRRAGSRAVVLYDDGEGQRAADVASTLVQRGHARVSLLSGGLAAVRAKYPRRLFGDLHVLGLLVLRDF
mgnify:CR=1 FL=1